MRKNMNKYILCYIDNKFAYFTNKPLSEQWGDDWDDAPYQYNAGVPYEDEEGQIIKVVYDGYFEQVYDASQNKSVADINIGKDAWLICYTTNEKIYSGASIEEFKSFITRNDGNIYEKSNMSSCNKKIKLK